MNTEAISRQEINLYTLEFHRDDQAFSFRSIVRYTVVFFVVLMMVEAYTGWLMWENGNKLVTLKQEQQVLNQRLEKIKQSRPLSQRPILEKQLADMQRQVAKRLELQKIMGGKNFGNFDGFSQHLKGLARQSNGQLSLTHIQLLDGGQLLKLQGWTIAAESVPSYLQGLRSERSFEAARFGVLHIERDPQFSNKLKFSLGEVEDGPS